MRDTHFCSHCSAKGTTIAVRALLIRRCASGDYEYLTLIPRHSTRFIELKYALQQWASRASDEQYIAALRAFVSRHWGCFSDDDQQFLLAQKPWNRKGSDGFIWHPSEQHGANESVCINELLHPVCVEVVRAAGSAPSSSGEAGGSAVAARTRISLPGGTAKKGSAIAQIFRELREETDSSVQWRERVHKRASFGVRDGTLVTRVFVVELTPDEVIQVNEKKAREFVDVRWVPVRADGCVRTDDTPEFPFQRALDALTGAGGDARAGTSAGRASAS